MPNRVISELNRTAVSVSGSAPSVSFNAISIENDAAQELFISGLDAEFHLVNPGVITNAGALIYLFVDREIALNNEQTVANYANVINRRRQADLYWSEMLKVEDLVDVGGTGHYFKALRMFFTEPVRLTYASRYNFILVPEFTTGALNVNAVIELKLTVLGRFVGKERKQYPFEMR